MVLVSHCVLNVNSKVEGLATSEASIRSMVDFLLDNNFGIIQMECPELTCMGIKRWGQSYDQYNNPFYENHCNKISENIVNMIKNYKDNGYEVKYLIGMDGSPTCGVDFTCRGDCGGENISFEKIKIADGSGMFIKSIKNITKKNGIEITFIGLDETEPENSLLKISNIIGKD